MCLLLLTWVNCLFSNPYQIKTKNWQNGHKSFWDDTTPLFCQQMQSNYFRIVLPVVTRFLIGSRGSAPTNQRSSNINTLGGSYTNRVTQEWRALRKNCVSEDKPCSSKLTKMGTLAEILTGTQTNHSIRENSAKKVGTSAWSPLQFSVPR